MCKKGSDTKVSDARVDSKYRVVVFQNIWYRILVANTLNTHTLILTSGFVICVSNAKKSP